MKRARISKREAVTMLATLVAACCFPCSLHAKSDGPRRNAEHVIIVVWDGMRPDFVTEANTPTLWKLAQEGVTFRNHHSVYPTLTNINATALATGVYPSRSGLFGNYEYRPEIEPNRFVRTDELKTIRQGDKLSAGKYLGVPTIAELVQLAGGRTAVAGTKSAPIFFDRLSKPLPKNASQSITLLEGKTLQESEQASIEKSLGPYPANSDVPSSAQDSWTTRALTQELWKDGVPRLSVLWMGEPDRSQHATAPGSETSLAAIKSSDTNLAIVLRVLEEKKVRDQTDILVVSDHGFSTIGRPIEVAKMLSEAGFTVEKNAALRKGAIRIAGNGGTILFYVGEHDSEVAARLVEWLQQTDFAGVIFSRDANAGTFPLSQVHLGNEGPDVVMAFRWSDRANEHGVRGMIDSNATREKVEGTHGSLSPFDIHNILFAIGPDFGRGRVSELPSSNIDVAPTVLHILGLKPPQALDGRILSEALIDGETLSAKTEATEVTRKLKTGKWRQYLRISTVGDATYVDEGNGGIVSN